MGNRVFSYQIRGTSGSGKTTVARSIMARIPSLHILDYIPMPRGEKIRSYYGEYDKQCPCIVLGSYVPTNGGCDTIPSVKIVAELLESSIYRLESDGMGGFVFFEGLMISHMLGTVGAAQMRLGQHRNVLAFLDTPLEVCLARVKARRLEAGNTKPLNETNTTKDWPRVHSSKCKAVQAGYLVTNVRHERAVEDVREQLEAMINGSEVPGRIGILD